MLGTLRCMLEGLYAAQRDWERMQGIDDTGPCPYCGRDTQDTTHTTCDGCGYGGR